jgi:predicted XRE-type DNA-binding protein
LANSDYFEISDIEVKQKGNNSLIAKQNALHQAMNLAFQKMIKMELKENFSSINSISNQQIQDCLYDYSIDQEKFSDFFYIGKFSYRFSKSKVISLLKRCGINIDLKDEIKTVNLSVYLRDFILHEKKLREMKIIVKKFSHDRIVFSLNREYINHFRKLRIKYAPLN